MSTWTWQWHGGSRWREQMYNMSSRMWMEERLEGGVGYIFFMAKTLCQ